MEHGLFQANVFHWGRVTHICVSKHTNIGSDNGLSPGWRQAIIWTNAGILLIGPLGTNFSGTLIKIYTFLFKKMHMKMSSGNWRPCCSGLNVLTLLVLMTEYLFQNKVNTMTTDGLGAVSIRMTVLPGMAIPMLKIRRPKGRLIFNMEITIRRLGGLYIETAPWFLALLGHQLCSHGIGYRTNGSLSSRKKNFNYLCHLSVEKW